MSFALLFLIQKAQLIVIIVDGVVDGINNIMDELGSFCNKIPESHSCNVLRVNNVNYKAGAFSPFCFSLCSGRVDDWWTDKVDVFIHPSDGGTYKAFCLVL